MNIQSSQVRRELNPTAGKARGDAFVLDDMKRALTRHLTAALSECSGYARDLMHVDADRIMTDLRDQFDPYNANSPIQDCFLDGFSFAIRSIADAGGEAVSRKRGEYLPSGVSAPVDVR